ncbi:MAG: DegV family protein [Oscillospiraceae bacterium]
MRGIGITTDCVCDLPEEYLRCNDVSIIYFYITTATGRFKDGFEITSANILEYLNNGGEKAETNAPAPEEYRDFFLEQLEKYDQIVHVSISHMISQSYINAKKSLELLGEKGSRVRVLDSGHLSTGIGHIVIKAVEMRNAGRTADEIIEEAEQYRRCVSTSFITMNADNLYRNGRVSRRVRDLCNTLQLHPVLVMKDGRITVKGIKRGNYEKAVMSYIKGELHHDNKINRKRLFITHAGCTVKLIEMVQEQAMKLCSFDEVLVTKASATISSNCGMGTVGVLFVRDND